MTSPTGLFKTQLEQQGINPTEYLRIARATAYHSTGKYNPAQLYFSSDDTHKLEYHLPNGIVRFGRSGYGDFIIYSFLERQGREQGLAGSKRFSYLQRARKIKGDWKSNPYSPNRLAMRILWNDLH